ncbi:Glutamine amidotransferase [Moorella glycerini]|uniref:Imidazole glycerol phosphate synthase subunit HisH n=1 Tax=Neomoorella stamsii TaxID=1266720 RepID=A0A9X7J061_9FIRM|nr:MULTISPECIES: imidazole glycerol phosphate synthase subunit HisH [Moorella]PRR68956.1 Imidazole glycerol phosphate synthase subunit HisH 1 [Moorella stamsii]CEP67577.1 Glutamine amidotransferase [Moorella glycerini]
MRPLAIIDYGMGNLLSVQKALAKLGYPAEITSDSKVVAAAPGVILPGVGAFAGAMANLQQRGLVAAIREVVRRGVPFLGICLGLQLLFSTSEEGGPVEGLNLLPGEVKRLPPGLKVPHMGWNQVQLLKAGELFQGVPTGTNFYFVHSYYIDPADKTIVTGTTEYGLTFAVSIQRGNLFGVQFHPEKSSRWGLEVLKNFGELVNRADSACH